METSPVEWVQTDGFIGFQNEESHDFGIKFENAKNCSHSRYDLFWFRFLNHLQVVKHTHSDCRKSRHQWHFLTAHKSKLERNVFLTENLFCIDSDDHHPKCATTWQLLQTRCWLYTRPAEIRNDYPQSYFRKQKKFLFWFLSWQIAFCPFLCLFLESYRSKSADN